MLRRFAIGALVLFVLVAALLYTLIRADAINDLKSRASTFATVISSAVTSSGAITSEDMEHGVSIPRLLERLSPVIRAFQVPTTAASEGDAAAVPSGRVTPPWEDVRIYADDGRVVLSQDLSLIGTMVEPGPGMTAALGGGQFQEVVSAADSKSRYPNLPPSEKIITYEPFRDGTGAVVGAMELVQPVAGASISVKSSVTAKLAIMGGGLLILYLGMLPVVARASRVQEEQKRITSDLLGAERETVERLRQLDRAKDDLLAFSAHEFRTPLTSLLGFAQTLELRRGELSEEMIDDYLQTIVRQARRLQRVANDFLDAAAIEAGRLDVVVEELQAVRVARNVASEFVTDNVVLRVEAEPTILADQDRVEQILTNLVRNAIQHGPKGAEITLHVLVAGGSCRFEVEDDGDGLGVLEAERIFDKFERGPDRTGGSGLGLYISRHLAEAQGGSLTFVADAPRTTFRLDVPLAPPHPVDTADVRVVDATGYSQRASASQ